MEEQGFGRLSLNAVVVGPALVTSARALAPVSDTPRLDAELLMAHALGVSREEMLLRHMDAPVPAAFGALLQRRLAHEPIAYITGRRAFWTIELEVGPGVLIPRADSETLLEAAVARFGREGPARVLDLGTGPGTLLLAALTEWPTATGLGVDASPVALDYARRNAERLGLGARAAFRLGDWGRGLEERFDLILCNPPYVEEGADLAAQVRDWEPATALFAGTDGLACYRRLAPQLPALLAPEGLACIELGAGQLQPAARLFKEAGFTVSAVPDLGGIDRALLVDLP